MQISCVSSSILLSNRTRYRAYFQMLPSEADISAAIYGAIQAYGWGYIAIITQNENILTLVSSQPDCRVCYRETLAYFHNISQVLPLVI